MGIETVDIQNSLQSDISKKADSKPLLQEKPTYEAGAKKVKAQNIEKVKGNVVEKIEKPKKTIETPNTKLDKPLTVPMNVEDFKSSLKIEPKNPESISKISPVTNKDQKLSDKQVKGPE